MFLPCSVKKMAGIPFEQVAQFKRENNGIEQGTIEILQGPCSVISPYLKVNVELETIKNRTEITKTVSILWSLDNWPTQAEGLQNLEQILRFTCRLAKILDYERVQSDKKMPLRDVNVFHLHYNEPSDHPRHIQMLSHEDATIFAEWILFNDCIPLPTPMPWMMIPEAQ